VAEILRRKEAEGVLSLRFDAETCVTFMFGTADGAALQRLTDSSRDYSELLELERGILRYVLVAD
jgi:hypothetical protein